MEEREERIDRLENITLTTVRLCEVMEANFQRMEENFQRMEENFQRMDANFRRMEENFRVIAENQGEVRTLLQQLSQAVTVLQADAVRIDETHA